MALYSQFCALCSQAFLNYELRKIDKDFTNLINSFIHDGDDTLFSFLMICNICSNNLKQFKLFIEKGKRSLKKFELRRQGLSRGYLVNSGCKDKEENNEHQAYHENCIEIILHESKNTIEQIFPPKKIENTITITEMTIDDAQNKMMKSSFENTQQQTAPLDLTISMASQDSELRLNSNDMPIHTHTKDRKQKHGSFLFNEKKKKKEPRSQQEVQRKS